MKNEKGIALGSAFSVSLLIFLISKDYILFWDTIQFAGYHPQYYFDSHFSQFFLPQSIDSGHFPFFGIYVAGLWRLFGRSLFISHLAMLPFVFYALWVAYLLGRKWVSGNKAFLFPLFLICLPQCIAQFMLVSPDVVLISLFIGLLWSIETKRFVMISIHALGLGMVSNRGIIVCLVIAAWALWLLKDNQESKILIRAFLPAILLVVIYQIAHFSHTGWVGVHHEMPWSESFALNGIVAFVKSGFVYIWRLADYFAVVIWLCLGYLFIKNRKVLKGDKHLELLVMLLFSLGMITVPFKGLMQHRYFLPILVLAGFLMIKWTSSFLVDRKFSITIMSTLMLLVMGNGVVYPDKIAQGWDSTLAHLPYYHLQNEVNKYLKINGIEKSKVATAFPLRSPQFVLNTNDDLSQFANKDETKTSYILYSNIMNDFSEDEIERHQSEWEEVNVWKKMNVKFILYRRI